jgi:hypothetical protein
MADVDFTSAWPRVTAAVGGFHVGAGFAAVQSPEQPQPAAAGGSVPVFDWLRRDGKQAYRPPQPNNHKNASCLT